MNTETIQKMNYSEVVGATGERNRCSGGIKSVHEVVRAANLSEKCHVLEIGCNTGFTSVNIARLARCKVTGIDINLSSLDEANRYAKTNEVSELCKFDLGDATALSYPSQSFDLVWASNVTSFIANKQSAISEYVRVLHNEGYLAFIPIYYKRQPPTELVEKVGEAIGTKLKVWTKQSWLELIAQTTKNQGNLELVYERDFEYIDRSEAIEGYCDEVFSKPELQSHSTEVRAALRQRLLGFTTLFNQNLQYCGFSIFLFQKRVVREETELFLSKSCT